MMRHTLVGCLLATSTWGGAAYGASTTLPAVTFTQAAPPGLLTADRDASANWRMAGLLSVGGIPTRTIICATLAPKGGGADDAGAINAALAACAPGRVVTLSAGTFTVAEGSTVQIGNSVTLRGAGAGSTILTRTGGATLNSYQPGNNPSPIIRLGSAYGASKSTAMTADGAVGAT